MWTRANLKSRAKEVLKGNYWKAFLIGLVVFISGANGGGGSGGGAGNHNVRETVRDAAYQLDAGIIFIIAAGCFLLFLAFRILLGYSLEVGSRKYFVESAQYRDGNGCYSFAFDGKHYLNIIATMFQKGLFTFLWTLLLIIPGIIKFYEYRMIPYILADNPNIADKRAFELSRFMTDGNKFDMFVLDLSFIGWYLLGLLAFGIGVLFVNPYVYATEAELYLVLKSNAIEKNYCTYNDFTKDNYDQF